MERITAGLIVLLSTITAIGNWVVTPKETPAGRESFSSGFSFGSTAPLGEVEVVGEITGATGTRATSTNVVRALRKAVDDGVKGILVTVDTPGGSAAASQEIFDEIWRIRAEKKIPVVCAMGNIAASGGYYVAAACDEIVANRATLTGSIGVIMNLFDARGLMQKIGVRAETIKTGPYKDIGSPFKAIEPAERQLLQGIIESTYGQFVADVAKGRKMTVEQVKSLAGGKIYTGAQARDVKLVDTLGSRTQAIAILAKRAGLPAETKVRNYTEPDWAQMLRDFSLLESASPLGSAATPLKRPTGVPLAIYEP